MHKKTAFIFIILIFLAFLMTLKPIDRTPLEKLPEYTEVMHSLDTMNFRPPASPSMRAGWSMTNITPGHPVPLAGYGHRFPQTGIHDSLFTRVMVLDNGIRRLAIVTIDLLLFPKILARKIRNPKLLRRLHLDGIYTGATHTHSSFGGWDNSLVGRQIFGDYEPKLIDNLTQIIAEDIKKASANLQPARIAFEKIPVPQLMYNRLDEKNGRIDPWLRAVQIERVDGKKALLVSYPAHPINIDSDNRDLSRDYPGVLVDRLQANANVDFAMFMAGMTGSHHLESNERKDFELTNYTGKILADSILNAVPFVRDTTGFPLGFYHFDSKLHISQMRISKHFAVRNWLFSLALGPLKGRVEVLRAGNILMIGLPCDFSGEINVNENLDSLAEASGLHLFITGFNGDYIGYITDDRYYDTVDKDEVRLMNWTGPHKGKYFADIIKKIIEKS